MSQLSYKAVCDLSREAAPLAPDEAVNAREMWRDGLNTQEIADQLSVQESRVASTVLVNGNQSYRMLPSTVSDSGQYRVRGKYSWGWAG
jgi:hypothetical protein